MARHHCFVMLVRRKPPVPEVSTMSEPNGSSSLSVRLVTGVLLVIVSGLACASHSVLVPPRLEATVSAELSVELLSTKSGGTLWRSSAAATEKVGGLALVDGEPVFSAKDPNDAYGQLVNRLVYAVTYDLRSTWVKQ